MLFTDARNSDKMEADYTYYNYSIRIVYNLKVTLKTLEVARRRFLLSHIDCRSLISWMPAGKHRGAAVFFLKAAGQPCL